MSDKSDGIDKFMSSAKRRHERESASRKRAEIFVDQYRNDKLPENLQRLKEKAQEIVREQPDKLFVDWVDLLAILYQALDLKASLMPSEVDPILVFVIDDERDRRGIADPDDEDHEILDFYHEIAAEMPYDTDPEDIIDEANYRMGKLWDLEDDFDED